MGCKLAGLGYLPCSFLQKIGIGGIWADYLLEGYPPSGPEIILLRSLFPRLIRLKAFRIYRFSFQYWSSPVRSQMTDWSIEAVCFVLWALGLDLEPLAQYLKLKVLVSTMTLFSFGFVVFYVTYFLASSK